MGLIEEDLEDLRALFHAEGEGLDEADVLSMGSSVNDLMTVLELDTSILIANLKQACPPLWSVKNASKLAS